MKLNIMMMVSATLFALPGGLLAQSGEVKEVAGEQGLLAPPRETPEAKPAILSGEFITKSSRGRYRFVFRSGDRILLRSSGFVTQRALDETIALVKEHPLKIRDMPVRQLGPSKFYFVLQTRRGDILATSPIYIDESKARHARSEFKRVLEFTREREQRTEAEAP